jgi:cytochrome d ubiquinol oxidase subunit II
MHEFLIYAMAALLVLILALYVILDGFDLGVGTISLIACNEDRRSTMMASLGPIWDGNETWLVMLGGVLFGAFPLVYSITLHALAVPILIMLAGLIFRGVAFEFREHAHNKTPWNWSFALGSVTAALAQGYAMGGWIQGIEITDGRFTGGAFDWLSPYTTFLAFSVVLGYVVLGLTYLIHKTSGEMQQMARQRTKIVLRMLLVAALIIMIWTPQVQGISFLDYFAGWHAVFPVLGVVLFVLLARSLQRGEEHRPFLLAAALFLSSLLGLVTSMMPYVVFPSLKLLDAAAPTFSLLVMVFGVGLLMPIMIAYNAYQYWAFRGKLEEGYSYHHH